MTDDQTPAGGSTPLVPTVRLSRQNASGSGGALGPLALLLGAAALVLAATALTVQGWIAAAVAAVLGVLSLAKRAPRRQFAIIGLLLAAIALVVSFLPTAVPA